MPNIAVIGAGLSGMCYGLHSKYPCVIYEQNDEPGGICTSHMNRWGVPTDVGPHIFFSKNKQLLSFFLRFCIFEEFARKNNVLYKSKLIKYPFENYIGMLPKDERDYCVEAFKAKPKLKKPAVDLEEFFLSTFGEGIYNLYLRPYNEKLWKRPLSQLSAKMANRIPKPPMQHILDAASGKYHEGFTHQAVFKYPAYGGCISMIQGLYASLPPGLEMRLTTEITKITILKSGKLKLVGSVQGERIQETYDHVVSTIPLPILINSISPTPPAEVISAASRLKALGVYVTSVHALDASHRNSFAITIPSPKVSFHRMTMIDFFGKQYMPKYGSTVLVETTYKHNSGIVDVEEVHKNVISGLHKLGIVASINVLDSATRFYKWAYPVYTLTHTDDVKLITDWLNDKNILPLGRFGSFEYMNMDRVYEQAKQATK
ncbi:MAG: FAD-dependent oxidoreductase [Dehalococcoidales bacterium]